MLPLLHRVHVSGYDYVGDVQVLLANLHKHTAPEPVPPSGEYNQLARLPHDQLDHFRVRLHPRVIEFGRGVDDAPFLDPDSLNFPNVHALAQTNARYTVSSSFYSSIGCTILLRNKFNIPTYFMDTLLASRMVQAMRHLCVTDLPITCHLFRGGSTNPLFRGWDIPAVQDIGYTGRAAVSERGVSRGLTALSLKP